MAAQHLQAILRHVQRLAHGHSLSEASDRELLRAFTTNRDEAAFAELVHRHGELVRAVCGRVAGHVEDAEDAFQATFLVLARKAGAIGWRESVDGWLYGVAFHMAKKAKHAANRRRGVEASARRTARPKLPADADVRELSAILDEELHQLPGRYRDPLVLCYLRGKTRDQAGRALNLALRTLDRRLARGRDLLRSRLSRRGISLSAASLAAVMSEQPAAGSVPAALAAAMARCALAFLDGVSGARAGVSAQAVVLAGEFVNQIAAAKIKLLGVVLLLIGFAGSTTGYVAFAQWPSSPTQAALAPDAPHAAVQGDREAPMDPVGDASALSPMPAVSRMVAGVVVDEMNTPIAGARVLLHENDLDKAARVRAVNADENGRFRFDQLQSRQLTLVAGGNGRSFAGRHVWMQEGRISANVRLVLTTPEEMRLRILDEMGRPVPGAELDRFSWTVGGSDRFWFLDFLAREGNTIPASDKDGLLTIKELPRGALCQARIKHPDFVWNQFERVADRTKLNDIRMRQGYLLTIIAVDARTQKPAPEATVYLGGLPDNSNLIWQRVGRDGRLMVHLPETQELTIKIRHPELICARSERIERWTAANGGHVLRAELRPKAKIVGRCVDDKTGQPVANVSVRLNATEVREIIEDAFTDRSGRYEIFGPEGSVTLRVGRGNGYGADFKQKIIVEADASRTTEAGDLKVKRLPTIHGQVLGPDGEPVARAQVMDRFHEYSTDLVLTDENGRFNLPMMEQNPYVALVATHPLERHSGGANVLFEDLGPELDIAIQLQAESEIRGQIVDKSGKARAGAQVCLQSETKCAPWSSYPTETSGLTDQKGWYRFRGVARYRRCRVTLDDSGVDRTPPRSDWITPTEKMIVVPILKVEDRYLKTKAESPASVTAPELSCYAWINSPALNLKSLRGKVVLLDFWASWSAECVAELPRLQQAHELYANKGLVVIGIHHNSVAAKFVEQFVRKQQLTFPIGRDDTNGATCEGYHVDIFPRKVLIDRNGKLVADAFENNDLLGTLRRLFLYGENDD